MLTKDLQLLPNLGLNVQIPWMTFPEFLFEIVHIAQSELAFSEPLDARQNVTDPAAALCTASLHECESPPAVPDLGWCVNHGGVHDGDPHFFRYVSQENIAADIAGAPRDGGELLSLLDDLWCDEMTRDDEETGDPPRVRQILQEEESWGATFLHRRRHDRPGGIEDPSPESMLLALQLKAFVA